MTTADAIRALELCQARNEVLHNALTGVVRVIAEIGGYLTGPQQSALAAAIDALGIKSRTSTWRDRTP